MQEEWEVEVLKNVIKNLNKKIAATEAVMNRFEDAVEETGYKGYKSYKSQSIAFDSELKFKYSGVWQNLSAHPYVEVPFEFNGELHSVEVRSKYFRLVNLSHGEPTLCTWANVEADMLELGYTQEHISTICEQYVLELAKPIDTDVVLVKETLPLKIRNLLPFI